MTRLLTLLACALSACAAHSAQQGPVIPPHEIAAIVVEDLQRAAAEPDAVAASVAWTAAHTRFENELEPLLRSRYADHVVAEVEYGFGRVHARLGSGHADEPARQLGERLAVMAAELQPQT